MIPSIHCVVQTKLIKNVVNVALDWAVFLHFIHNSLLSVAIVLMLITVRTVSSMQNGDQRGNSRCRHTRGLRTH